MPYKDKNKQRAFQRDRMAERRKAFFSGKRCLKCTSCSKLELHHVNPAEKEDHKIWSWSEVRFLVEVAKCVVLCRDCHKKISDEQLRKPLVHGTRAGYMTHSCRCVECVQAASDYRNSQRYTTGKRHKAGLA